MYIKESILDNINKSEERAIPTMDVSTEEWPEWMFIIEADIPIIGKSPIKDGRSTDALNRLFEYFGVPYKIWYLDGREFSEVDVIDHSADDMFAKGEYFVCFMFDFPETVREQVQLIINLMSLYWNTFWGYSNVYVYRYDGVMYIDVPERTKNLVAAAHDIAGFSFYLKHNDAKRNYQFEGKKLTELKMKIYNMLPDSSFTSVETAGRYIDSLIKVRKRRLKKFRHCGDENGNDVKWRPITEGLLDNIENSDAQSSDVLSANATVGNPLDYNNLYLFNIETEGDIDSFCEGVRPIFDKYKINYMFKTYTRSEIRELPWADLQKEAHFMRSDKFLCIFFDRFPVTMVGRVQWLLKIFTVYIQEFSNDVSIYRFEKNDADIFILKSEGHVVRTWYKGYFGLYDGPDRKSYDDTLFVSQFATLLNTSDHTIYFEIEPILKKIRERFLDRKSAKLTESVLDDLEHSEITQDDIVRAKQQALYYDEMYLFNVVPGNTEIISPLELIGDLADAMAIDIYMEPYDEDDFDDVEYIDHSDDDSFQTNSQLCVYINQPTSDYDKAKFLIMLMEIISHEYEVGTDVRLYRRNSRDIFKMDTWQGGTMMQLINMCSLRIRDIKEGRDVQSLMSYGSTIAVYQDVCNLLCFYTDSKMNCVERAIRNLMKHPIFMNESKLNESILDNVERTSTDISDVISDNEHGDFRYMLVIPGDSKGGFSYKDKDIAIARTEQAIKSLGVDCKVECYLKDEYDSLDLNME